MAQKKLSVIPPTLIKKKAEGMALLTPLRAVFTSLAITNTQTYAQADALLGRVFQARQTWKSKLAPIVSPLQEAIDAAKKAVTKAKEAMGGAEALDSEVDGPLEELEGDIRQAMSVYKLEEARQAREVARAQEEERQRLVAAIEETANKELAAPTRASAQKLAERRQTLVQQAVNVEAEAAQTEAPAKGTSSQARSVRVWKCLDIDAVIRGCAEGTIPADVLYLDTGKVLEYFREPITRAQMDAGEWPGIVVEDDVVIARQGVRRMG